MITDVEDYDDEYPTCEYTNATLRIYHESRHPDVVTALLGIAPDEDSVAIISPEGRIRPAFWLLSTDGHVNSRDVRRHLDWLILNLAGKRREVDELRELGYVLDVFCRWDSIGQGGPTISPSQMAQLANLNLSVGFDVYT